MSNKEELNEFQQFCKLNDKYIHFQKPTSKYVNGRIAVGATIKLLEDNEGGFDKNKNAELHKSLEEFSKSLEDLSNKEIEEISKNIEKWLKELITRIYNFKQKDKELTNENLNIWYNKIYSFLNETGAGLNPEVIYKLVVIFCI